MNNWNGQHVVTARYMIPILRSGKFPQLLPIFLHVLFCGVSGVCVGVFFYIIFVMFTIKPQIIQLDSNDLEQPNFKSAKIAIHVNITVQIWYGKLMVCKFSMVNLWSIHLA